MMVYLAADAPLPLIEWQEDVSVFSVTELIDDDHRVRKQFSKQFVYYLGSYEGCSCGFSYENEPAEDEDDMRRDVAARESVRRLSEYLSSAVQNSSVELFACWDGDQEAEPEERLVVTLAFFGGESFAFKEKQFIEVEHAGKP